jgi:RNA polymerase sigma-70 factor (ECF subfamily)
MISADFSTLWERYRLDITRFIHARIRYDTREQREDMVQEVYARAWIAMCKGKGANSNPKGWLYQIAHHLIVDYYEMRSRRPVVEEPEPVLAFMLDTQMEPHELFEQVQLIAQVQTIARTLTPAQELVILRRLDGYAYAEIASELGKDEGACKALRHRATRHMMRYLEQL